jgi:hypothetical protein
MSLAAASNLHRLSENISLIPTLVRHQPLGLFARNVRRFEANLDEHAQDEYWRSRLRTLKRYRYRVCATPLGFDDPDEGFRALFEELQTSLAQCDRLYPDFAAPALDLVRQAQSLAALEQNPILDAITGLTASRSAAVLINEPRFVESTEILLSKHLAVRHLKVRTPNQLRGDETYGELILIGPMRWFPDHVMLAPRAARIHQVRFDFLADGWQPRTDLVQPVKKHTLKHTPTPPTTLEEHEPLTADDMLPEIDWDAITRSVLSRSAAGEEVIEARFVKLAEDNAVFLDAGGRELVIDIARSDPIRSVKVSQLQAGLFLVVRERGKGAYIVPIANRLLGERAEEYRAAQAHWKTALRRTLMRKGMGFTLSKLRLYGARSATAGNVRNWSSASERKIRTRYREDFAAILTLVNMEDDLEHLWKVARAINHAHHRAGVVMKRRLLDSVRKASLNELEKRGCKTFQIEEYQTNLTAYRIEDVSRKTTGVPLHQVGELLHVEDDNWRE